MKRLRILENRLLALVRGGGGRGRGAGAPKLARFSSECRETEPPTASWMMLQEASQLVESGAAELRG